MINSKNTVESFRYSVLISGTARSGKDFLTQSFIKQFAANGILARRYAFADELKRQLDPLLLLNLDISAFTEQAEEKKLIRPILLAWGQICRNIDPDHWVKGVAKKIKDFYKPHIAIISDVRYLNEFEYFSGEKKLLHVTRLDDNGNPFPPVGVDEEKNDPILIAAAEKRIICEDFHENSEKLAIIGKQFFYEVFGDQLEDLRAKYPIQL